MLSIHIKIWDADDVFPTAVLLLVQEKNEATKLLQTPCRPRANASTGSVLETCATRLHRVPYLQVIGDL